MMKRKKWFASISILVLIVISFAGCSSYDVFEQIHLTSDADDTIIIGVFEAQTGEYSAEGNDEIKGIELANDIYSEVLGKDVQLIIIDNQSSIYTSESAIEGIIKLDPVAIIGSAGEACSLAASEQIMKAGIPTITPSCINPLITLGNDYYFRTSVLESMSGEYLAEYAVENEKAKNIGIIKIRDDDAHRSILRNFKSKIESYNKEKHALTLDATIDADQVEFETLLGQIESSQATVIFMPVGVNKADLIFTEIEERELTNITFIGTNDWNNQEFFDMMNKHPEIKIAFISDTIVNEENTTDEDASTEASKFLLEYQLKYGENEIPSPSVALGYDSYLLIINAINAAGTTDRDAVRDALADTYNLKCVTGTFRFTTDGNPIRPVNIATLVEGMPVLDYIANDDSPIEEDVPEVQTIENPEELKATED